MTRKPPEGPPKVSLIVGSASDRKAILPCRQALDALGIPHEARVLSAHRTIDALADYIGELEGRGVRLIIAAAGLAAHLPGVIAAQTRLPVLGVPLVAGPLQGLDALFSVVQMPGGVPVACMGIGKAGAKNAAYLAARILGLDDAAIRAKLDQVVSADKQKVLNSSLPEDF
ncbi:MAG: 5-(carboxyamino)imidazole ribonucleotide mutase [Myxococcota bacterium]